MNSRAETTAKQTPKTVTIDEMITATELQAFCRTDFWTALTLCVPSLNNDWQGLWLIDGERVPLAVVRSLSVYDIAEVQVCRDPMSLSRLGIHGAHSAINVTTRKHTDEKLSADYHLDVTAMTDGHQEQTALAQRHQADVWGGDGFVGYLFTAQLMPASRGLSKESDANGLGLRSYVNYRRKALHLHNDLSFGNHKEELATELPTGSFNKATNMLITDRFGAVLDIAKGLTLKGHFSLVAMKMKQDLYNSPSARQFAANTDMRQNGTYHIGRNNLTTYEGGACLTYEIASLKHSLLMDGGMRIYASQQNGNSFGGRGILSDRMSYVSFTLAYDTVQAPTAHRTYERNLQGYLHAHYVWNKRYGVVAEMNITRSSLLAPQHKNATYYSGKVYWNMHEEEWMSDSRLEQLTIALAHGTSGAVDFSDRDFTAHYQNNTQSEYIYNYYLTGATLMALPNENLKPARRNSSSLMIDAQSRRWGAALSIYHHRWSNLLAMRPLPMATGFVWEKANGSTLQETGADFRAHAQLINGDKLRLNGAVALNYHVSRPEGMERDSRLSSSILMNGQYGRWTASAGVAAGKEGTSIVQSGYTWPLHGLIRQIELRLTAENLFTWGRETADIRDWYAPVHRYTLTAGIGF